MTPRPPAAAWVRVSRALLAIGMAAPVIAFMSVGAAAVAYPNFDHARQYLSELGGAKARVPIIFNLGVLGFGALAAVAGPGFGAAVVALNGARIAAALTSIVFVAAGTGLVMASLYPWPDPRHMAINLGLGIQLAPLLLLWGLARDKALAGLRRFLTVVFIVMAVLTILTKHLLFAGLVNDANVGWWERGYAIVLVGWAGVAAYTLDRRLAQITAISHTAL